MDLLRKIIDKIQILKEDIDAVKKNDPAARTIGEILLAYPGLHAIWIHRVSHYFHKKNFITFSRLISHINRFITGIEIHPGANIGKGVFIDHGMGIVIGETATIGDGCLLYKGVVLGGTSRERKKRHPQLGKNVTVGSNACILGPHNIGDGAKIGAGSVVITDVPPNATVVGIPGKVVTKKNGDKARQVLLDHADLPDPVIEAIKALVQRHEAAEEKIRKIEKIIEEIKTNSEKVKVEAKSSPTTISESQQT